MLADRAAYLAVEFYHVLDARLAVHLGRRLDLNVSKIGHIVAH